MRSDVGIGGQSLPYGFLKEIMDHLYSYRVPKTIGSDVPNLMKDVPNFVKCVPSVSKCVPRWESAPNHFLMGSKMKSCTFYIQMGNMKTIGLDVPNLMKGCTKFCERYTKICERCTKRSKVCSEVGIDPQSLPNGFQN